MKERRDRYRFRPEENRICISIGTRRNEENVRHKTQNKNFSDRDDLLISVQGVFGEYAFRRMLRLPFKDLWDTHVRNTWSDTFDAALPLRCQWGILPLQVDVKCVIKSEAPGLLVMAEKAHRPAHMYVLVYLHRGPQVPREERGKQHFTEEEQVTAWFQGFAYPNELFVDDNITYRENQKGEMKKFYLQRNAALHSWEEFAFGILPYIVVRNFS
jgi:hypothetical protein